MNYVFAKLYIIYDFIKPIKYKISNLLNSIEILYPKHDVDHQGYIFPSILVMI